MRKTKPKHGGKKMKNYKKYAERKDIWILSYIGSEFGYAEIGYFGYKDTIKEFKAKTERKAVKKAYEYIKENML